MEKLLVGLTLVWRGRTRLEAGAWVEDPATRLLRFTSFGGGGL